MKVPNLEDIHIIFHQQKPIKYSGKFEKKSKPVRGYTICKIYRGDELIGEGKVECAIDDNFSRPLGRAYSMERAFNEKLSNQEKLEIFNFVSNFPGSQRFFQGKRKFLAVVDLKTSDVQVHILIPEKPENERLRAIYSISEKWAEEEFAKIPKEEMLQAFKYQLMYGREEWKQDEEGIWRAVKPRAK